jgi:hypothetical protein
VNDGCKISPIKNMWAKNSDTMQSDIQNKVKSVLK